MFMLAFTTVSRQPMRVLVHQIIEAVSPSMARANKRPPIAALAAAPPLSISGLNALRNVLSVRGVPSGLKTRRQMVSCGMPAATQAATCWRCSGDGEKAAGPRLPIGPYPTTARASKSLPGAFPWPWRAFLWPGRFAISVILAIIFIRFGDRVNSAHVFPLLAP
jgi:hypothetical protein